MSLYRFGGALGRSGSRANMLRVFGRILLCKPLTYPSRATHGNLLNPCVAMGEAIESVSLGRLTRTYLVRKEHKWCVTTKRCDNNLSLAIVERELEYYEPNGDRI